MKRCVICKEEKLLSEFNKNRNRPDGKQKMCRDCQKEYRKNNNDKYTLSKEYRQKYYESNKESLFERGKEYRSKNIDRYREYQREYRKERRSIDIDFRLSEIIRYHVRRVFEGIGTNKEENTFDILDYTPKEFKNRIEQQLTEEMNWSNYGTVWEIDHIKPISWFIKNKEDFDSEIDLCRSANELNNLQPLLKEDNRSKGSIYKI